MGKESFRKMGTYVDSLRVVRNLKRGIERRSQTNKEWKTRYSRWHTDYFLWRDSKVPGNEYVNKVRDLASQLPSQPAEFSTIALAEERVSLERFCELALAIPIVGIPKEELQRLGFTFAPIGIEMTQPRGTAWVTKYPAGWEVRPANSNRIDQTATRHATVFDERGQERIEIFWQHSTTGNSFNSHTIFYETNV